MPFRDHSYEKLDMETPLKLSIQRILPRSLSAPLHHTVTLSASYPGLGQSYSTTYHSGWTVRSNTVSINNNPEDHCGLGRAVKLRPQLLCPQMAYSFPRDSQLALK